MLAATLRYAKFISRTPETLIFREAATIELILSALARHPRARQMLNRSHSINSTVISGERNRRRRKFGAFNSARGIDVNLKGTDSLDVLSVERCRNCNCKERVIVLKHTSFYVAHANCGSSIRRGLVDRFRS